MPHLALHLLGPPRIERDHVPISVGYSKAIALLAYLAVTQQRHTREALAALLWPDHNPTSARGELRRMIYALTKSLGKEWLDADRRTVKLQRRPELWLDVDHFHQLLAASESHDHSQGAAKVCAVCLESLTEAVALADGDFLDGFSLPDSSDFDTWHTLEAEALRRELTGALERLVQIWTRDDNESLEQAMAYARRWLASDPLNEAAHQQLMQLYARVGQSAAALRQYQECAQILRDELDVEPSVETSTLCEAIKVNRLPLLATAEAQRPRKQAASKLRLSDPRTVQLCRTRPSHNLPAQPTPFIGRQQEVSATCELLLQETVRLVTLTGSGGTGKTRLALQVASALLDHFSHGVVFVPLAELKDPNLVLTSIAKQFDVRGGDSQLLLELLKSNLQEKHLLLLLDNFEQVIVAAPTVAQILAVIPNLKMLVTSRAPLNLRGEHVFRVPPLKLPERTQVWSLERLGQYESLQLFVERAQAVKADFALTADNALAVAEICHRLDGLPLAIELAAARIKLLPPRSLLARLDCRLKLLTAGPQDLPRRQQTLRNTLDWSYGLLAENEQILFARLAVFVGGFTLETAEAICNADSRLDVFEGVTSLLNNSLLMPQTTCTDQPRFRMLETIREYALEQLAKRGEMETLQQQQAHYFANWVAEFGLGSYPGTGHWLDLIEEEHDNLRAVLSWSLADLAKAELGSRMVGILYWFWYQHGYISEGCDWCRQLMTFIPEMGRTAGRASVLLGSGSLALMQGDLKRAAPWLAESVAIWRDLGDERRLALGLTACGVLGLNQGDLTTAQHNFEESLAIGRRLNHRWFIAASLLNLGGMAVAQGNYTAAQVRLVEAAVVVKTSDDDWLAASVLNNLGEIARVQGDYEQARRSYSESEALLRKTGHKPDVARSLHNLGYVVQHRGDYDQAQAYFQESLAMFRELGNKRGIAECLAGLAGLAASQGQPQGAARLLGAAEAQLSACGASWWPADVVEYERNLAAIQAALDQEIFAAAWKAGQAMSLEQAIAYALDNQET